jgi:hypothetical protein
MFDDAADLFLFIEGDDFPETNSLIRGERKRARWRLCFSSCDGFFRKGDWGTVAAVVGYRAMLANDLWG